MELDKGVKEPLEVYTATLSKSVIFGTRWLLSPREMLKDTHTCEGVEKD